MREVSRRDVQCHFVDHQVAVQRLDQLIDRRTAGLKVQHHLRRHLGRESRDALRRDPVISGEDSRARVVDLGQRAPLPARHEDRDILKVSQCARGLSQDRIPADGLCFGGLVPAGQVLKQSTDFSEGGDRLLFSGHWFYFALKRLNSDVKGGLVQVMTVWKEAMGGLATSLAFLTRVPLPSFLFSDGVSTDRAVWAFPVVGALIGVAVGALLSLLSGFGFHPFAVAVVVVAAGLLITGALHEDGLADVADGLGGGDPARRREIMKDSRLGAFGVLALVLTVLLKVGVVFALADPLKPGLALALLVGAAAWSRALMTAIWAALPPANPGGWPVSARMSGRPQSPLPSHWGSCSSCGC